MSRITFYRCDQCGAERTDAPIKGDRWFELDVIEGGHGWPKMQFRAWQGGASATHLCQPACLRAWIDAFMEISVKQREQSNGQ